MDHFRDRGTTPTRPKVCGHISIRQMSRPKRKSRDLQGAKGRLVVASEGAGHNSMLLPHTLTHQNSMETHWGSKAAGHISRRATTSGQQIACNVNSAVTRTKSPALTKRLEGRGKVWVVRQRISLSPNAPTKAAMQKIAEFPSKQALHENIRNGKRKRDEHRRDSAHTHFSTLPSCFAHVQPNKHAPTQRDDANETSGVKRHAQSATQLTQMARYDDGTFRTRMGPFRTRRTLTVPDRARNVTETNRNSTLPSVSGPHSFRNVSEHFGTCLVDFACGGRQFSARARIYWLAALGRGQRAY